MTFTSETNKNENNLEIVSDENLNLNKERIHIGGSSQMRTVVYKEVEGGLILAIFVHTYYVDDPYFTSQKQYLRLEELFKSANTAYKFFLIISLDISLT